MLAAAMCAWHFMAGNPLSPAAVLFFAAVAVLSCISGAAFLRLSGSLRLLRYDFFSVFLCGALILQLAGLALQLVLPFWPLWRYGILVLAVLAAGKTAAVWVPASGGQPAGHSRTTAAQVFALFIILAAASFWSQDVLFPWRLEQGAAVFKPWSDYFVHAAIISAFKHPDSFFLPSRLGLAGVTLPFYHYGSYVFPLADSLLNSTPSLVSVCSLMTPLGFVLSGLAIYVLIIRYLGAAGAFWGVVVFMCLPDPSFYGLHNKWFSYFWLQQISPSSAYGVSAAALAFSYCCAVLDRGTRLQSGDRARAVIWALLWLALTLLFKAQIFVLAAPVVFCCLMPGLRDLIRKSGRWLVLPALAGAVLVYFFWPEIRRYGIGFSLDYAVNEYLPLIISFLPSPEQRQWLTEAIQESSFWYRSTVYLILSLSSILGVFLPLGIVFFMFTPLKRMGPPVSYLAAATLVIFSLLALFLAPNLSHEKGVLHHRSFVLLYFVMIGWCGGMIGRCLSSRPKDTEMERVPPSWAAAALLLGLVPLVLGSGIQRGPAWGASFVETRLPADTIDCLRFARENISSMEVLQDLGGDASLITGALSERRAFLAGGKHPAIRTEHARRSQEFEKFKSASSAEEAYSLAAELGISWLVVFSSPDGWPGDTVLMHLKDPAYQTAACRLYDMRDL